MIFEIINTSFTFFLENPPILVVSLLLALPIVIFWLIFYYHLSRKLTIFRSLLLKVFILGAVVAFLPLVLEKGTFSYLFPKETIALLGQEGSIFNLKETLLIFLIAFLFTALIEEVIKFFFLKTVIFRVSTLDQIVDGIKLGIVFGLGFGTVENIFFFFSKLSALPFSYHTILLLFLIRFFLPTLMHSIYGGIMGYFLSLAKFYRIFSANFLRKALIVPFLIHGSFNFLLFTPFNFLAIFLTIFTLLLLLKWYSDRENFQIMLTREPRPLNPPIFAEPQEMQALIFKNLPKFHFLKKFGICPFCFKKLKLVDGKCSYCNLPISTEIKS